MRYTLSVAFFYVAAYALITGSSFVYIDYFGIPSKYYGAHRLAAIRQRHPLLGDACGVFCGYAVDNVLDNSSVCLAKRARGVFK